MPRNDSGWYKWQWGRLAVHLTFPTPSRHRGMIGFGIERTVYGEWKVGAGLFVVVWLKWEAR